MIPLFAARRLEQRIREQDAELREILDPQHSPIGQKYLTIVAQTWKITGKPSANPLFKPNKVRRICERLAYAQNPEDLLRWYDTNYLVGRDFRLVLLPAKLTPIPPGIRFDICSRVADYYRARYVFARWLYNKCEDVGCYDVRVAIVSQLERMLTGSPSSVRVDAYQRVIALNETILAQYRYIDAVLDIMVNGNLTAKRIADLRRDAAVHLSEYANECCREVLGLSNFAWRYDATGRTWTNLVTGAQITFTPAGGIRRLVALPTGEQYAGACRSTPGRITLAMETGCRGTPKAQALATKQEKQAALAQRLLI